jgi:predicted DCC family thiol-disulfide oxidoreductase YuxK
MNLVDEHSKEHNINPQRPVVIYDEECALCNFWVRFLLRTDRRGVFLFAGQHTRYYESIADELAQRNIRVDEGVVLVYRGRYAFGPEAVWMMMGLLGGWWRGFLVFSVMPKRIQRSIYILIARNRYRWFGRYSGSSRAGSKKHPGRFLE